MKATLAALLLAGLLTSAQEPPAAPAPTKLFAVLFRTGPAWDAAKPPNEQAHFRDHSSNLAALRKAEKIALGGRYADVGLIVVKAADEAELRAMLANDASLAAGVFKADVHPWSTLYEGCVSLSRPR